MSGGLGGERSVWRNLSIALHVICLFAANQALGDDFLNPSQRYLRENVNSDVLSHWVDDIGFSIIGAAAPETKLGAYSAVSMYARASETPHTIMGEPENWFSSVGAYSKDTNYLMVVLPENTEEKAAPDSYVLEEQVRNQANLKLFELVGRPVPMLFEGCYASWLSNEENEISAFVGIVAGGKHEHEIDHCINYLAAVSFGVSPYPTSYSFSGARNSPFLDESEAYLLLQAGAYCRNVAKDNSQTCATTLLKIIFDHHGKLIED